MAKPIQVGYRTDHRLIRKKCNKNEKEEKSPRVGPRKIFEARCLGYPTPVLGGRGAAKLLEIAVKGRFGGKATGHENLRNRQFRTGMHQFDGMVYPEFVYIGVEIFTDPQRKDLGQVVLRDF